MVIFVIAKYTIDENPEDKFGLLRCSTSEEVGPETSARSGVAEQDIT